MATMDQLEGRSMLAADVSLSAKGTLTITGTSEADTIIVSVSGKTYTVTSSNGDSTVVTTAGKATAVKRITINSLGGSDRITVESGVAESMTINAGSGNDRVDVGGSKSITVDGGTGDDRLRHIVASPTFRAVNVGGNTAITDTIRAATTVAGFAQISGDGNGYFIVLGAGNTKLIGGSGNDEISTSAPGDTIDGGAGIDRLITVGSNLVVKTKLPATPPSTSGGQITIREISAIYALGIESYQQVASTQALGSPYSFRVIGG